VARLVLRLLLGDLLRPLGERNYFNAAGRKRGAGYFEVSIDAVGSLGENCSP
jgi:hypothetical protein